MTEAPREIWATINGARTTFPGRCTVEIGGWEAAPKGSAREVRYVRADLVQEMIEACRAEVDARALYLATAPDRGGMYGPKGQRKQALEAAQARTAAALRKIEEGRG